MVGHDTARQIMKRAWLGAWTVRRVKSAPSSTRPGGPGDAPDSATPRGVLGGHGTGDPIPVREPGLIVLDITDTDE